MMSERAFGVVTEQMHVPVLLVLTSALAACQLVRVDPVPPDPLVAEGERLFFEETFDGNGRTCGTCHRAEDNFTLSPALIATLPPDDPLFVAETNPDLGQGFESPRLTREFALILENLDGFENLAERFTLRGIPHTLGLRNSVASASGQRMGWSGDGAPGDGRLRSFATGAVIQHFTKTTARIPGVDFRLPTDAELDALEAFQLSLGRQEELELPLPLRNIVASRGQEIFLDRTLGKCNACHFNAGANADPGIFGLPDDNRNFNTGVENLPDQPADLTGELVPPDNGFGRPNGNGEFNTPSVVEAADTGPFFHNNAVETIEGAVAFYNGAAFNDSPAGQLLIGATGSGIELDATQVVEVAAFLRVINALENIRESVSQLEIVLEAQRFGKQRAKRALTRAAHEAEDGRMVLAGGGLAPVAVSYLDEAYRLARQALEREGSARQGLVRKAMAELESARNELVEEGT
jgi:mono/diheme cytochrome c family protein